MSPNLSRISFAFLLISLGVSAGDCQAWKDRLESAAGASQAAAGAATPEQTHALSAIGAGRLSGENTLSGLGLIAPPVKARTAAVYGGSGLDREGHEWGGRHYYEERESKPSRPWKNATTYALGGALAGAVLGALIGVLAFGPPGLAAGAVVGGILGIVTGHILGKGADAVTDYINRW